MRIGVSLLLLALLAITGCRSPRPVADLGSLYNEAAQRPDSLRNPVVVIPGILGSKLVDGDSETLIWGAFGRGSVSIEKPEGMRLISLPMRAGVPLAELRDGILPEGVLDRLVLRLPGFDVSAAAYSNILRTLGVGGYRDDGLAAVDYGGEHFTCYQFPYDWRRSSAENAAALGRFLDEKRVEVRAGLVEQFGSAPEEIRFDLVAHSMGGLVARYFLRYGDQPAGPNPPVLDWRGARGVDTAILVGTPNAGSIYSLHQMTAGFDLGPFVPGFRIPVIGTMPAVYELLPRARHGVLKNVPEGLPTDPLDPALWEKLGWGLANPEADDDLQVLLPESTDPEERRTIALDHLRKCLESAGWFQRALDRPSDPPPHLRLALFAGDAEPTHTACVPVPGRIELDEEKPGDGTVARYSALMDERMRRRSPREARVTSPIGWAQVHFLFEDHLGLTKSSGFADNALYLLLEGER